MDMYSYRVNFLELSQKIQKHHSTPPPPKRKQNILRVLEIKILKFYEIQIVSIHLCLALCFFHCSFIRLIKYNHIPH